MPRGYGKENAEGNPLQQSEKQIWEVWILHDKDTSWVLLLSKTTKGQGEKILLKTDFYNFPFLVKNIFRPCQYPNFVVNPSCIQSVSFNLNFSANHSCIQLVFKKKKKSYIRHETIFIWNLNFAFFIRKFKFCCQSSCVKSVYFL